MSFIQKVSFATLGTGLMVASTQSFAANLITNGSFEDPVIGAPFYSGSVLPTGWTKSGAAGDASIWRVGYVDGGGDVTVAGDGFQFVTMGGGFQATGDTTWSQTVSGLTIGQSYQLDFKIAAEGSCCGSQTVVVDFLGSSTPAQNFTAASPSANYWKTWIQESMLITPTASSVTVRFTYTGRYDLGLDDVRLAAAVPEPESYAMLLCGMGMLSLAIRRRRA